MNTTSVLEKCEHDVGRNIKAACYNDELATLFSCEMKEDGIYGIWTQKLSLQTQTDRLIVIDRLCLLEEAPPCDLFIIPNGIFIYPRDESGVCMTWQPHLFTINAWSAPDSKVVSEQLYGTPVSYQVLRQKCEQVKFKWIPFDHQRTKQTFLLNKSNKELFKFNPTTNRMKKVIDLDLIEDQEVIGAFLVFCFVVLFHQKDKARVYNIKSGKFLQDLILVNQYYDEEDHSIMIRLENREQMQIHLQKQLKNLVSPRQPIQTVIDKMEDIVLHNNLEACVTTSFKACLSPKYFQSPALLIGLLQHIREMDGDTYQIEVYLKHMINQHRRGPTRLNKQLDEMINKFLELEKFHVKPNEKDNSLKHKVSSESQLEKEVLTLLLGNDESTSFSERSVRLSILANKHPHDIVGVLKRILLVEDSADAEVPEVWKSVLFPAHVNCHLTSAQLNFTPIPPHQLFMFMVICRIFFQEVPHMLPIVFSKAASYSSLNMKELSGSNKTFSKQELSHHILNSLPIYSKNCSRKEWQQGAALVKSWLFLTRAEDNAVEEAVICLLDAGMFGEAIRMLEEQEQEEDGKLLFHVIAERARKDGVLTDYADKLETLAPINMSAFDKWNLLYRQ